MSLGYGGYANKTLEDEKTVIYEYGGYNLDIPKCRNENHACDGSIAIPKSCFAEPEIHEKIKKMPNGKKKLVVKRIPVEVEFRKMISDGLIEIENCSSCWMFSDNIDITVLRILSHIFTEYQLNGEIPEHISFHA